jgi:hypothetical protein
MTSILNYAQLEQAIFKRHREIYDYTYQLEDIENCRRSLKYAGRDQYKRIKKVISQCLEKKIIDYIEPMSAQDAYGDIDRYISQDNPPKTFYQYYTDTIEKDDLFLIRVSYDVENMDVTTYLDLLASRKEIADNLVTIFEKGDILDPFSFLQEKESISSIPVVQGFTLHPISKLLALSNVDISRLFDILYYENNLYMGKVFTYNTLSLDIRILEERFKFIRRLSSQFENNAIDFEIFHSDSIVILGKYKDCNYLPFVIELKGQDNVVNYTIKSIKDKKYAILEKLIIDSL